MHMYNRSHTCFSIITEQSVGSISRHIALLVREDCGENRNRYVGMSVQICNVFVFIFQVEVYGCTLIYVLYRVE